MKKTLLALGCFSALIASSQAALVAGNIAFVGFNADGLDNLAFVALTAIPAGEEIYFSDDEWNGTTWTDNNESNFRWTAPAGGVAAGTIVLLNDLSNIYSGTPAATTNLGTLAPITVGSNNAGIGNSDEAIWAYQANSGTPGVPTGFVGAIANDSVANTLSSLTGTGLSESAGTAFFFSTVASGDEDIFQYIGPRSGLSSFSAYLDEIKNPANWVSQDGSGDQGIDGIAPNLPFDTTGFTIVPEPASALLGALGLLGLLRRRR